MTQHVRKGRKARQQRQESAAARKQIIFSAKGWKYVHKLRRERAERGLEEPITESAKRKYETGGTKVPGIGSVVTG